MYSAHLEKKVTPQLLKPSINRNSVKKKRREISSLIFFMYMYIRFIHVNPPSYYSLTPFNISGSTPGEILLEKESKHTFGM